MTHCTLCPRRCGADRTRRRGFCGMGDKLTVARADLHWWEEPCLVGKGGSGAVFFSGCSLRCVFCQNYVISHEGKGESITPERLVSLFEELQNRGAENINLVNPTHFTHVISQALDLFSPKRHIPVVWNSGGYERPEVLETLAGQIDIFLPDLKYVSPEISLRYSGAADYFGFASASLETMFRIAGYPKMDEQTGMMQSGVLVRHLVLPSLIKESYRVIDYLTGTFDTKRLYVSLMCQYFPSYRASEFPEINRRLTTLEYQHVLEYAHKKGLHLGFCQEKTSAKEEYVPTFYSRLP